jgi:hypothetical protein
MSQPRNVQGNWEVRGKKNKDDGLTTRLIMSMAVEMAEGKRNMDRACVIFQTLAVSAGVSVTSAFEATKLLD